MSGCAIRAATLHDAEAISAIYSPFVLTQTTTFELDPPDSLEIATRMDSVYRLGYPYLVAEHEGQVVGYAYASPYRPRPAYRFTVEDSVYLNPAWAGRGIGRQLIAGVIAASQSAGACQMIAAIAGDNPASVGLHTSLGFQPVGILRHVGFKFDRWVDVTLMQRAL